MANDVPGKILVVDDDPDTRANLCDILELDGFQIATAGSIAEALHRDKWSDYIAVLLDRRLPDGTAEDFLPRLKELAPEAAVLIVTGFADLQGAIAALRQGAADYILKPINPDALRASLRRITDARKLALAKERSEAAFRTLVEAAPSMIVILRPDRTIVYFSPFAEQLTGYRAEEVVGKDYFSLFLPDKSVQEAVGREIGQVLAGQPARGFENPIRAKDGVQRWIIWNAQRLADYEGGPAILAVGQDITSVKESQERALQAGRLAAIGQMVTGLAHESGNALARSQACLEMLAMEVEDRPEAMALIGRIQKAQDHLRQLYEDVRGYAAPLKLDREVWDVSVVWRQAWDNLAVLRQGRQATFKTHSDCGHLECSVDQFRLGQVFRNVFENALAACKDPVEIEVACEETMLAAQPALRIAVRDNGPGMKADVRQRIFEPFFTTKTKGTGLGMAIAKRIIDAHGGRIELGPESGRGAEIIITLPRGTS
jgi:PAS domain S-box-containing protein